MTDFCTATAASRRLALLRLLREAEGSCNESVLRTGLGQLGFRGRLATEEAVREDLVLLKDAGLVTHDWYEGRVLVVHMTRRGDAYLRREAEPVPGVDYPGIGV